MFVTSRDKELTGGDLLSYITKHLSTHDSIARLRRYYRGQHDILDRTNKEKGIPDNRVLVNHARYITDMCVSYLIGNPVEWQIQNDYNIDAVIESFRKQAIQNLDTKLATDASVTGLSYEIVYADGTEPRSAKIQTENAFVIYDDSVKHEELYAVIYELDSDRKVKTFTCYTDKKYTKYIVTNGTTVVQGETIPHYFGLVPLVSYANSEDFVGDFEQAIPIIDAYNLLQSERINDKEQLVDALLVGYGVTLEPEQMKDIKTEKNLFGLPENSKVQYVTKSLNEAQVDILRQNLENDIHKISKVPNMSDKDFAGNSSGVAISYKLLAFDYHIKNKERFFEEGLLKRFQLYNNFLVNKKTMKKVPVEFVDVVFKRSLPQNLVELSQVINNLETYVDDETLVGQLPFIKDAKETIQKNREEELEKMNQTNPNYGELTPNGIEE